MIAIMLIVAGLWFALCGLTAHPVSGGQEAVFLRIFVLENYLVAAILVAGGFIVRALNTTTPAAVSQATGGQMAH